jgi:hypothetical protein
LIVSVKDALAATIDVTLRLVIVGAGGLIVKLAAGELPVAFVAVTLAVPAPAIRLAGTAAVSCVALT